MVGGFSSSVIKQKTRMAEKNYHGKTRKGTEDEIYKILLNKRLIIQGKSVVKKYNATLAFTRTGF